MNKFKDQYRNNKLPLCSLIMDCNKDFMKLECELAKYIIACREYESKIDSLKIKLSVREGRSESLRNRRRYHYFGGKSLLQLRDDLSFTENKLKQEIVNRNRLKSQLQQKFKYRDRLYALATICVIEHWIRIYKITKLYDCNLKLMMTQYYCRFSLECDEQQDKKLLSNSKANTNQH
eukprot:229272_1